MDRVFTVRVGAAGDQLTGSPGDWVVQYDRGTLGVVSAASFAATYDLVEVA
jgi:hypothetical protein